MAASGWAQTALTPPQAGFMLDGGNSLRPVYGIAGNFLLGDPAATGVVSAAFSGCLGLLKTDSALIAIDRQGRQVASTDAPDGSALFAFSRDGTMAVAFLTGTQALVTWDGSVFQPLPLDLASAVLAVAMPDAGHAALIAKRDDGLWDVRISLATGAVVSQTALVGVTAPVMMLAGGELVYGDANGIVVRRSDGSEKHIDAQLPQSFSLQQMGEGWVQLRDLDTGRGFAIRITENREQFYALPEVVDQ